MAATLTVTGTGFTANTIVAVNGISLPTTYISASQVTAAIAAGQFATVATLNITVSDSGSTASNSTVTLAVENPLPTIAGINPSTAVVGSAATNVNVAGTGFMSGTVVRVNGTARSTTFTSAILATVSLTMEDLATVGSLAVTAFNPTPGGGTSSAATFSVVNPAPGAITISPSTVTSGGTDKLTITVTGSGFVASSVIQLDGVARATTFVSSTQLTTSLSLADQASGHVFQASVVTPAPGGGASSAATLTITNAAPALTSISPGAIYLTAASTVINLRGTGFQPNSTVLWNGAPYATTFISSTQLSIQVLKADVPSTENSSTIQVSNPAPAGGTSGTLRLPIYAAKPTIASIQETVIGTSCQQIRLIITGQNFPTSGVVLTLGDKKLTGINGSTTSIIATLPANLGVISNPQLIIGSTYFLGLASDPFTLSPKSSVCFSPSSIASYPGTTLGIDAVTTTLGQGVVTVAGLTLPAGFTTTSALPYTLPSRIFVATDASVAAGTYSIGLTATGAATANATLPVTVISGTPSFYFASPLTNTLAVPTGGSTGFTLTSLANSVSGGTVDFKITLSANGLPQGVTASFEPAIILPGDSVVVTLTAAANAPIRQNVPISIVGTVDGSSVSASVALVLNVAPTPGNIPNNRTAFTSTQATPSSVVYDHVHNLVYAANQVWNRIDVISNVSHAIVRSIPVSSPTLIDLSQDSGTLWIAGLSEQIFAMDTTAFTMKQYALPAITALGSVQSSTWTVSEIYALADGKLLLVAMGSSGNALGDYVWSPGSATTTSVNMGGSGLLRSPDGTKVFGLVTAFTNGCVLNVYSTTTNSATTYTVDPGFTGSSYCGTLYASNADGSMIVASVNGSSVRGVQLLSGTGQALRAFTPALSSGILSTIESVSFFPRTFLFSQDGRTLYQTGSKAGAQLVATYDAAIGNLSGLAPAISSPTPPLSSGYGGNTVLVDADSSGMLIGIQSDGVAFEDSTYFQDYGTTSSLAGGAQSFFSPLAGPLSGGTTFSAYGYVALQPDVWFGNVRGTTALSSNNLTLTSPAGEAAGPVNLKMIFPDGVLGYAAQGFSYGPYAQTMVYNGSAPAGGAASALTGFGLPADSAGGSISVDGNDATITSTVGQYPAWTGEAVPSTYVKFTLPAGKPGYADLQLQTPNGTIKLPKAVFYASNVTDYGFTGTASSVIYDKFRKRAYVILKNSVLVFATDSGSLQSPITAPTVNNVLDLRDGALSTDGIYLTVGNPSDGSVAVLNLDTPASSYAIAVPSVSRTSNNCTAGPGVIAALPNNRALVLPSLSNLQQCGTFTAAAIVDLQAHTQTAYTVGYGCYPYFWNVQAQSNADGSLAVVNVGNGEACLYSASTGFTGAGGISGYSNSISADGNLISADTRFTDVTGRPLGRLAQPPALYGTALTQSSSRTQQLQGVHLNASGGLYYVPHAGYFEIIDTATATLRMRFSLTQTVQNVVEPMAIDEGGRKIFLLTDAGLTVVDLGQAPLSVGHLGTVQPVSGGTIQLRGSGFDTTTTVTVDSIPASAKLMDENTLTVSLPALNSGAHDLILSRDDGSTLTVKGLITIP